MLSDSRGVPIICILFLDFARFVIHSLVPFSYRRVWKGLIKGPPDKQIFVTSLPDILSTPNDVHVRSV